MAKIIEIEIMDGNRFQPAGTSPDHIAKVRIETGFGEVTISGMKIEKPDTQLVLLKTEATLMTALDFMKEQNK